MIKTKEEQRIALHQLELLRDEMTENLREMEDIIIQLTSNNNPAILTRAKSYWMNNIACSLTERPGSFVGSMVNFFDTMKELEEIVECEEE